MNNIYIRNRKATFNFEVFDTFEAGIELMGSEVKSIRLGKVNITESHISITKLGDIVALNMRIEPYKFTTRNIDKTEPLRPKRLLLHKSEINKISGKIRTDGFTAIILSIYINKRGKVKMQIALAKGKKLHDKRQSIKERDLARQESKSGVL